jgi:hypothetical protein
MPEGLGLLNELVKAQLQIHLWPQRQWDDDRVHKQGLENGEEFEEEDHQAN